VRLVVAVVVLLAAGVPLAWASGASRSPMERLETADRSDVLVMPHRGWWRQAPENSLLAVELALEAGMAIVEIDVRRTADGAFVVLHDKTLDRTTTGSGRVDEVTLAEVRSLRLLNGYGVATGERVPTLSEVMALCRGRAVVYIDKSEGMITEVAGLLEREGTLDHAVFYGRRPLGEIRRAIGPLFERIRYIPKVDPNDAGAFAYIRAFLELGNVPAVIVNFESDSPRVTEMCRLIVAGDRRIMMAPLWPSLAGGRTDDAAVRDPAANWGWMLDRGASILCTDRPGRLLDFVADRAALRAEVLP